MQAKARTPRELFDSKVQYLVPAFQRPYVWTEEDQWAPLWDDVRRVAETYVNAKSADSDAEPRIEHFLGAVVYESKQTVSGDVARHDVIDGQQRMTTLQLLLDAVHEVVQARGHQDMAESLEELILNDAGRFRGRPERFKLWPSQADRAAFVSAMEGSEHSDGEHQIIGAHGFFRQEAERWLIGKPTEDGDLPPGSEVLRVEGLCSTLQDRLVLVAIDLGGHDDSQLIFETLNDRGTPLLKADLVKNWVFRRGEELGCDVMHWAEVEWAEFDGGWWREEISQGRLKRSRIDIFLQYWLTMRLTDEVKADNAFRVFTEYAGPLMTTREAANDLLAALRRDADTYRSFAQLDDDSPEGRFYYRVIERLELAVTTPVFLWMLSENHNVPADQVRIGLGALESWAIRRMILRLTSKDLNRFSVAILKMLEVSAADEVGDRLFAYLSEQTAETRFWPTDVRITTDLSRLRLYGNVRQDRLRVVLSALEQQLRDESTMYETTSLPPGLEIEHVMPQGWRTYWDPAPKLDLEGAARRDQLVNSLGNLTLITRSLNGSLSNRPWTDGAAIGLTDGGEPDLGKRTLLNKFSLLVLNKGIVEGNPAEWTDGAIVARSGELAAALCSIWPGPDLEIQAAALEAATGSASSDLGAVPWSDEDVQRLAGKAGASISTLLDTLASDAGKQWRNADFIAEGLTNYAFAAVGALGGMTRGSFNRSNSPIEFHQVPGTWAWSVNEDFASKWRAARNPPQAN